MEHIYAVIMAGGGGTRLWPISRRRRPKQMLKLFGERSLYQKTVYRLQPLISNENIYVVTVEEQAEILGSQTPQIPTDHFIIEPMPKGTASVVGIAASLIHHLDPESVMAVLPADHHIGNEEQFRSVLNRAYEVAAEGDIVTIGIKPTYAATGYGYIHQGERISEVGDHPVYKVLEFVEKPSMDISERYIASGDYVWNSGMFIWRTARILDEIAEQMPQLSSGLARIRSRIGKSDYSDVFLDVWNGLESETIDYGVMEKASGVRVIPAGDMEWFDIGGWDGFFKLMQPDKDGNVFMCEEHIHIDMKGSLIFQQSDMSKDRLVAVLGLEDMIVVETEDVTLICPRKKAEEVRALVQSLSKMGKEKFL